MKQYIISYLGGDQPSTSEEGKAHFAKYQQWLGSLSEAAIKPMVPFKNVHTIRPDRSVTQGSSVAMTGHTVIKAQSIEQAIEITKSCPFLDINGTLEVAELIEI